MSYAMIALVNMRGNLVLAAIILIVGAGLIVGLSRREQGNGPRLRKWIPLTALFAGPVIAVGFWAADVFVFNPDMYPTAFPDDAMATLSRCLILGIIVGVVASVVFFLAGNARRKTRERTIDEHSQ